MKQPVLSVCLAGLLAGSAVCSLSCSRAPMPPTPDAAKDSSQAKNESPRPKDEPTQPEPKKPEPKKAEPTQAQPKKPEPKKAADPVVVSAETLAQAVQDDVNTAVKKYHLTELQVDGVVGSLNESKGQVGMFRFNVMVKDRKTDKMVGFTIFCGLKEPLPEGDKRLDEIAVGKRVTIRGNSFAMGNGQVTLGGCVIVREGEKGGGKKEAMGP